jgi:hypothetical protein
MTCQGRRLYTSYRMTRITRITRREVAHGRGLEST